MDLTLVKASGAGDRDRVYLGDGPSARRVPVHAVHDLPHLVVESRFAIDDGLFAELAAGAHSQAARAATARSPHRHKQGRIVSGAAGGEPTAEWLTPGHRRAKAVTNWVTNRSGDGPDTPAGVRDRAARGGDVRGQELIGRLDDETIASAIRGVRDLQLRWTATSPGATLRLSWPLAPGQLGDRPAIRGERPHSDQR